MQRLVDVAPELEALLNGRADPAPSHDASAIRRETVWVAMRDGVRLATDLYLPPQVPAPAVAMRTPYGRAALDEALVTIAQHGYVVVAQDCRGTGDSEPDHWDYYVYEREDSIDLVDWIQRQPWSAGFLGALGGSYVGGTQWCMARHPAMSAIAPRVQGLGVVPRTSPRLYMFISAYSRSVGKGSGRAAIGHDEMERRMIDETLSGGYFNEPLRRPLSGALLQRLGGIPSISGTEDRRGLYEHYSTLAPAERAELIKIALGVDSVTITAVEELQAVFGHRVPHDAHMLPRAAVSDLVRSLHAPALLITGWYDWFLDDALATWERLSREGREPVCKRSRLLITPSAHNAPGYRERPESSPELMGNHRSEQMLGLLLQWYATVRADRVELWPRVIYYMMGANQWRTAPAWPPPDTQPLVLHLGATGTLTPGPPQHCSGPDCYAYDPDDPTPTVGGSIVSSVYIPGSVDVSEVQQRADVLTYTTDVLASDLEIVGSVRLILYASSSAVDTDFSARLSDVFPNGRAVQLQSATLRARYRNPDGEPELLEPGRIYRFEIDMCATANRFASGHRLRLDLSSADFPKFDRNTNRGGEPGPPITATQTVYHDAQRPSRLLLSTI